MVEDQEDKIRAASKHLGRVKSRIPGLEVGKDGSEGEMVIFKDDTAIIYPDNGSPPVVSQMGRRFDPGARSENVKKGFFRKLRPRPKQLR